MSWNVVFTFVKTKNDLPDETTLLSTLPTAGDYIWTTPGFFQHGESDDWADAYSWKVQRVDIYLEARKATALITLEPYVG